MDKTKTDEFKMFISFTMNLLNEMKTDVDSLKNDIIKNKGYTKQLALQNSILLGFIKYSGLEEEYSTFSKAYTDWDKNG